jgi:hypothetical protein
MGVEYFPESTTKRLRPVAEQQQQPSYALSFRGTNDLTASGMDEREWTPSGWVISRINLTLDSAGAKDYSINIMHGRGIVTGKNDRLFFKIDGYPQQPIILDQGFYIGTELAAHLKSKLDADSVLGTFGPYAVTYDKPTGLFTIETADAGNTIKYFYINETVPAMRGRSTAGAQLGFTEDSAKSDSITSDTAVLGLDSATEFLGDTASIATDIVSTSEIVMTVDNALQITVSTLASIANYEVVYTPLDVA